MGLTGEADGSGWRYISFLAVLRLLSFIFFLSARNDTEEQEIACILVLLLLLLADMFFWVFRLGYL